VAPGTEDENRSPFDAVEQGPEESGGHTATPRASGDPTEHPSVTGLQGRFGSTILHHEVQAGDQHVVFVDAAQNREVLAWLKDDVEQRYDLLVDVTAVDYGGGRPIQVVYQLWSVPYKRALRVKCELPLDGLSIDSVVPLWRAADWLEREVFDLFGVDFRDHPDLRRILMPQNYAEGHPLRKDFPLRGRFSRAEQTRRALSQDYQDDYTADALEIGGAPGLAPPKRDDSAEEADDASRADG
jgi:NADH-quinone oxidoreductase subunit C